jgi:hypothetical protein
VTVAKRRAGTPAASATTGLSQVMRALGGIVAPTTLLTSLLFYFGYMHAFWFFDYFGVNSTLLGLTTGDFVMRSADALFLPATVLGCAVLALVWGHAAVRARLTAGTRSRALVMSVWILGGVGLTLASAGLLSVFIRTPLRQQVALAPLCLGGGVLLTLYAVRLRRATRGREPSGMEPLSWTLIAEWAGVFVLVALSLFWAATDYSAAVGRSQAHRYAVGLADKPDVALYSDRSLRLTAPGVREVRCRDPEAAYRFRYDGLKLMLQSGDQYVFLPERWSRANGAAIVIPRSDALRLEFSHADAAPPTASC